MAVKPAADSLTLTVVGANPQPRFLPPSSFLSLPPFTPANPSFSEHTVRVSGILSVYFPTAPRYLRSNFPLKFLHNSPGGNESFSFDPPDRSSGPTGATMSCPRHSCARPPSTNPNSKLYEAVSAVHFSLALCAESKAHQAGGAVSAKLAV